jgi:hypothetical protein
MPWSDNEWDDFSRRQPGTFWGEYGKSLDNPAPIIPPVVDSSRVDPPIPGIDGGSYGCRGAGSKPQRSVQSLEDLLGAGIQISVMIAGGYVAFLWASAAELSDMKLILACSAGALVPSIIVVKWLQSEAGQRFLAAVGWVVRIAFVAAVVVGIIWAWSQAS